MAGQHQPCHHHTLLTYCSPPQCGGQTLWESNISVLLHPGLCNVSLCHIFSYQCEILLEKLKEIFPYKCQSFHVILKSFTNILFAASVDSRVFKIVNKMYFTSVAKLWVVILITWRWCRLLSSLSCLTSHKTDYFSVERQRRKVKLTHWLRWKVKSRASV